MFTGLIEEVGIVRSIRGRQLQLSATLVASDLREGDSVSVNGCCLTATMVDGKEVTFDLLEETVARTNLGNLGADSPVNLERALTPSSRIGGHFVQGHIDCTAPVLAFEAQGKDYRLELELPEAFAHYAAFKGSIALNGVSLTIAEVSARSIVVWIIPHTWRNTNFHSLRAGNLLNVEFDLLAKYVERLLPRLIPPPAAPQ